MQFSTQDLFVGALTIALGAVCLYGSLGQRRWFLRLHKVRWLQSRLGKSAARWLCVVLAAALILFGSAIAMGFSLQRLIEPASAAAKPRTDSCLL
jgi:hypothetical protein